jgi:hypothetical protein
MQDLTKLAGDNTVKSSNVAKRGEASMRNDAARTWQGNAARGRDRTARDDAATRSKAAVRGDAATRGKGATRGDMRTRGSVKVPSGTFVRSVRSFVKSRTGLARRASRGQRFDKDET